MAETSDNAAKGVVASIQRILERVLATVHNRIELFGVEFQEERRRLVRLFLLSAGIIAFGVLSLSMLTLAVLLAAGPEHRCAAALGLGIAYLAGAVILTWILGVRLKHWHSFEATRQELQKDREWLKEEHPGT
jgi:uncharacterized membrane protein YqjE